MKVKELLAKLNNFDPDMDVHFAHSSPDRETWLAPCAEDVHAQRVIWSFNHDCPKITETLSEQSLAREVVVLFP